MRFAILCRVSSEDQLSGQSLDVQRKTLRQCVKSLGGEIVKEYIGQESATKSDRPILDSLLADCSSGLFDCVMVYDSSRLDRDPVRAKISFATFKKYGIKLYIQHSLYDLNNPESAFIASLMSEVSQFQVAIQTKKGMESRRELAKRGYPLSSHPHGRIQVETNKNLPARYEIATGAKEQAESFYDLYVNQKMDLDTIGKQFGTSGAHVSNVLFKYSGPVWTQVIRYEGREEQINVPVPPLLTAEQIEKARSVTRQNKKFNSRLFSYLLGGRIRCELCKMSFTGQSNKTPERTRRYYVHSRHFRTPLCIKSISVELIENAVFMAINNLFSSLDNLKEVISNALSVNKNQKSELTKKIEVYKKTLEKLNKGKDRLIDLVFNGTLTEQDISKKISQIKEETFETEHKLKALSNQLNALSLSIPSDLPERIHRFYLELIGKEGNILADWSQDRQQLLVDWFFGHHKDCGVFIAKDPTGNVVFNVRGAFNASYLGIIEKTFDSIQILGFKELDKTLTNNAVDFNNVLQTLGSKAVVMCEVKNEDEKSAW